MLKGRRCNQNINAQFSAPRPDVISLAVMQLNPLLTRSMIYTLCSEPLSPGVPLMRFMSSYAPEEVDVRELLHLVHIDRLRDLLVIEQHPRSVLLSRNLLADEGNVVSKGVSC